MYHNFKKEECVHVISVIENKLESVLKRYPYKYEIKSNFDLEEQFKIFSVVNACYEEINITKGSLQNEFVKISSLCNAMSIFPIIKIDEDEYANKNINFDLILSVLFELTSAPLNKDEVYLCRCDEELKKEIIKNIDKIMKNPRISPYKLSICLEKFYNKNKKTNNHIKIK